MIRNHCYWQSLLLPVLLFAVVLVSSTASAKQDDLLNTIEDLDKKFQALSIEYFSSHATHIERIADIEKLVSRVNELQSLEDKEAAVQFIYSNMDTLKLNAFHPGIIDFFKFLIEQNQWSLAKQVQQIIIQSGDELNLLKSNIYLAAFYADHLKWSSVLSTLGNNFSELADSDAAYAYLLQGTALQHLKQHRKAIKSYEKISLTSRYSIYAQLNTAIADIRLGWLSDARKKIKAMIEKQNSDIDQEITNRLYLILGYALLQKEYYRDARTAFRNISLESRYSSKALLGIALSATNQGDYIGGLTALAKLKKIKTNDLPYDESFLVQPLLYQKLKQPLSVASTYSEAVDHYTQRLLEVEKLKAEKLNPDNLHLDNQTGDITIDQLRLEYTQKYPTSFFTNRNSLIKRLKNTAQSKLKKKLLNLLTEYNNVSRTILDDLLQKRQKFLTSYLNQARYGLARHYDNQQRSEQK